MAETADGSGRRVALSADRDAWRRQQERKRRKARVPVKIPREDLRTEAAGQHAEHRETLVTPPLGISLANVTIRRRRHQRRRFGLHGTPPLNFKEEDQAIIQHFDFAHCHEDDVPELDDKENDPVDGNAQDGAGPSTWEKKEPRVFSQDKTTICSAKGRLLTAVQQISSKERLRRRKPQLPLQNACVLISPSDGCRGRARSLRAARISKRSNQSNAEEKRSRSKEPSKTVVPLCGLQRLFGG